MAVHELFPNVSFPTLYRARDSIEDFVQNYFGLHSLEPSAIISKFLILIRALSAYFWVLTLDIRHISQKHLERALPLSLMGCIND